MKKYDVIIVGGSTTGSWFAKELASRGHSVVVIEKEEKDNISRQYDIVHFGKKEMEEFGLTIPAEGDSAFGFTFDGSPAYSPYGNHPKISDVKETTVGLHKHEYIIKMQAEAQNAGAEIINGASFTDFIKDEKNKIIGVKYADCQGEKELYGKIVADCSGIPSVARTKLPTTSYCENKALTNKDLFFVVLYYIKYKDPNVNPMDYHGFFLNYKSWSAPSGDPHGAILGIGGCYGYEYAEEIFLDFQKNYKLPEYTIEKVEKWVTPYHRALFSFVDDGFIAMGDCACLTKPNNGEGCTASLVQGTLALNTIDALLKEEKPLSKENLWTVNKQYFEKQGIAFDSLRPILMGAIMPNYEEAEYLFSKDLLYCKKILASGGGDLQFTPADIANILGGIVKAIATKKLRPSVVGAMIDGVLKSGKVSKLYKEYPQTPAGYFAWKAKADALWREIGGVCDTCDKELVKKLGYEE